MTDNMREFVKFFVMGLAKDGMREPVAYLYNGVRLPKLPEWDRESYPYACIADWGLQEEHKYKAYFLSAKMDSWKGTVIANWGYLVSGVPYIEIEYDATNATWGELVFTTSIAKRGMVRLTEAVWSSYDIYYADDYPDSDKAGTLYLAATDPLPIYE